MLSFLARILYWVPIALGIIIPAAARIRTEASPPGSDPRIELLWVFIGTYTEGASKGIYRLELNLKSGKLSHGELAATAKNPSFLAIHPNQRFLYAVSEVGSAGGERMGGISAFSIDSKTGKLMLLNQQSSRGSGPCHLVIDRLGKHVLAANYGSGNACVLPIRPDGGLGEVTGFVQHHGASVNPQRQEGPHAHSINLDPANSFAFVADLGLDKVMIYPFNSGKGTLTTTEVRSVKLAPGAGPRHFAFHPSGRFAYVINELDSTLTALAYEPKRGTLKTLETVSTLPKGFGGNNTTAEVQVHPSGKFVYGSNRGHDSIAIFAIDAANGRLSAVGHQGHHIRTPRNFCIDPTGEYLLVANQDANSIGVFRIDSNTGMLSPTGSEAAVPMPVCVKMMPIP